MKKLKRFIWLIVILLTLFFMGRGWWQSQFSAVSSEKVEKVIVVAKGDGFSQVAEKLKKENLIRSTWAFKLRVKELGVDNKLSEGTFKISPSHSVDEIVKILTSSPLDNWVTLIEGWRVEEIAEKLNQALGVDKKEFLKYASEGYMFPDTYLFPKDYSAKQIVQRLKNTFDARFNDEIKAKIKKQGLSEKEGVILASIVEREARSFEVRKMVASILLKRFRIGMGLNVDASIQYALGYQSNEKSWWKRHLTHEDLQIDSSYNTYIHAGLTPTPICNPSLSSLQAVADAIPTDYLYYFHDLEGNSYYAKTLEEHNQNVAAHR